MSLTLGELSARLCAGWPGVGWSLNGESIDGLIWPKGNGKKPTLAEIEAVEPPPPPYRDKRAEAYRDELGEESGSYLKTIGDTLDALIAELRERAEPVTPKFAALTAKVDEIKARIPKP